MKLGNQVVQKYLVAELFLKCLHFSNACSLKKKKELTKEYFVIIILYFLLCN